MSLNTVLETAKKKMNDSVEHTRRELSALRTGRATLQMLDGIKVDYYGTDTPLAQVCGLTIPDPTMIVAQPWDVTLIQKIEKAIRSSDLGLNPANDGKVVRIPVPQLTEDRRRQLAKKVHEVAEHHRTAIRLERREGNEALKRMLKDKTVSEDDEKRGLEQIQKLTDQHIKQIDEMAKHKEEEILKI
ncbi:MAG TPA: ribosome recycling factor [Candidatus Polarisedimenticolia bacterium]|nr:ribosome recycling factor [Candidatus Polarisedimenticolia bacterium]